MTEEIEDVGNRDSIGDRIRELRLARGWALDRLGRETGLSRGTIWEAENRKNRVPWQQTLEALAKAFDVPVEYLRTGKAPASETTLADFAPEIYLRAKGVRSPARMRIVTEIIEDFVRLDQEDLESGHLDEVETAE